MHKIIFAATIFFLTEGVCIAANSDKEEFVGAWIHHADEHGNTDIECPDVLILDSTNKYELLNDCSGPDPLWPVVESGNWSYDSTRKELTFTDRKFTTRDYHVHGNSATLTARVDALSAETMVLCFDGEPNCSAEEYRAFELKPPPGSRNR